tara:strand:+ start:108 stop:1100 length:993 start_codon:yes stop_codon:yes gene_type:complete
MIEHQGVRVCINCGSDDAKVMHSFTRNWLIEARQTPIERLDELGIDDDFSSSIVKCNKCGCDYIRDVLESRERNSEWDEETLKERLSVYQGGFSRKQVNHIIYYEYSIISNLLNLVLRKKKDQSNLSLLDFGSSFSILSPMARVMGFSDVVAYDPLYPPNISKITPDNHPINFEFLSNMEDIKARAPYDAIICQSADEHFYDLQGEIKNIHNLLSDDGVVFWSHPVMDLDADINLLRNEANISDKETLKRLRATFHVHHLNYVMPKMFKGMLKRNGFREAKVIMLDKRIAGENRFSLANIKLLSISLIKYFLGIIGSSYRKNEFFLEKSR